MNRKIRAGLLSLCALGLVGSLAVPSLPAGPPAPETIASEKIKDLAATLTVQEVHRDELKKMGGAFATNYSAKEAQMFYKFPNKFRFQTKFLGATVSLIYNGNMQAYKTPILSGKKDLTGKPGGKQTLMDLGIFARDYIATDYQPVYQRTDGKLQVYKMVQRGTNNTSHEIVWVNPSNAIIEKRESYNGDNILQKTLLFKGARVIRPGIWVPARIEVYNKENKLALVQSVDDVKVNLGVEDDKFKVQ